MPAGCGDEGNRTEPENRSSSNETKYVASTTANTSSHCMGWSIGRWKNLMTRRDSQRSRRSGGPAPTDYK